MKSVDIFSGIYGFEDEFGIDLWRQRELDEDAIDGRIAVQVVDELQHFASAYSCRRSMHPAGDPELLARSDLAFHVKLRCRIVTHQYSSEARTDTRGSHGRDLALKLGENLVADFQAIENARGHVRGTPVRNNKNHST